MRREFAKILHEQMKYQDDIYLITADLGYHLWDEIQKDFPDRFYNVGSSEMTMLGVGIGLAMENKTPFVYSITPFLLCRPFEMIRNYLNHEKIPVKLIGGGRNRDYGDLGFSHWAEDDIKILESFPNITLYKPETLEELESNFYTMLKYQDPFYLNLSK